MAVEMDSTMVEAMATMLAMGSEVELEGELAPGTVKMMARAMALEKAVVTAMELGAPMVLLMAGE